MVFAFKEKEVSSWGFNPIWRRRVKFETVMSDMETVLNL